MKITIDTKEDSPVEIGKVIQLLSNLLNTHSTHNNIFESPVSVLNNPQHEKDSWCNVPLKSEPEKQTPAPTGFMNMFVDVPIVKEQIKKESNGWDDKDNPPSSNDLMTY